MDVPDQRKIHSTDTPSMGGIPIFLGAAFALLIWFPSIASNDYKYLFGALVMAFVVGLRDDLIPLRPIFKLISQLVPGLMVIGLANIRLESFYDLLSLDFPIVVTWLVTIFVIVVITNSINLIDGIDGLAGSISSITLVTFGIWFYLTGNELLSFIIFSFVGSILSFLLFNWQPSKIFMGDTGALLLGFLLACVTILFIHTNFYLPNGSPYKFDASIATAICIMIIPLFDTFRVFILRILKAKSPFTADNNHIHHLLIKLGLRHSEAVLLLVFVNLIFVALALLMRNLAGYIVLPTVITLALMLLGLLTRLLSKAQTKKAGVK